MAINHDIEVLMKEVDDEFSPSLSSRMIISEYIAKLVNNATIFSVYEHGCLTAFAAMYCNDFTTKTGFLAMIAVGKNSRGKGLGFNLLQMCVQHLKKLGFVTFKLEVYKNNKNAIAQYSRFGFDVIDETDTSIFMALSVA